MCMKGSRRKNINMKRKLCLIKFKQIKILLQILINIHCILPWQKVVEPLPETYLQPVLHMHLKVSRGPFSHRVVNLGQGLVEHKSNKKQEQTKQKNRQTIISENMFIFSFNVYGQNFYFILQRVRILFVGNFRVVASSQKNKMRNYPINTRRLILWKKHNGKGGQKLCGIVVVCGGEQISIEFVKGQFFVLLLQLINILLEQASVLHALSTLLQPGQFKPPQAGAGLLQYLILC